MIGAPLKSCCVEAGITAASRFEPVQASECYSIDCRYSQTLPRRITSEDRLAVNNEAAVRCAPNDPDCLLVDERRTQLDQVSAEPRRTEPWCRRCLSAWLPA
jgi:hypothetical protein